MKSKVVLLSSVLILFGCGSDFNHTSHFGNAHGDIAKMGRAVKGLN